MAFINEKNKEINCKIVYFGPPRCGKSTSLRHLCQEMKKDTKGDLITLTSEDDKTLYFDFIPVKLGKIGDFTIHLHLYTVPGEIAYEANRKIISKGVDGVVLVADSQLEKVEANIASLRELQNILKQEGVDPTDVPMVIQYNKRDLPNAAPLSELRTLLNKHSVPDFETIAKTGEGVLDAFRAISTKVLMDLKKAYQ